jgi:hypothetical protein
MTGSVAAQIFEALPAADHDRDDQEDDQRKDDLKHSRPAVRRDAEDALNEVHTASFGTMIR